MDNRRGAAGRGARPAAQAFCWDEHFTISRGRQALPDHVRHRWEDYIVVYAWFLALQIVDLLSTFAVLSLGGVEGNPVGAALLADHGAWGAVALKVVLIAFTAMVWIPAVEYLSRHPRGHDRWGIPTLNALLLCAAVYYSIIVVVNLSNAGRLLAA